MVWKLFAHIKSAILESYCFTGKIIKGVSFVSVCYHGFIFLKFGFYGLDCSRFWVRIVFGVGVVIQLQGIYALCCHFPVHIAV